MIRIDWTNAKDAIGQPVFVSGKVVNVSSAGRVNFLNFDTKRPPDFVAVVFRENLEKFPGELKTLYAGKLVEIRGLVTTYQDKPQIVVTRPEQIKVIDVLPKTVKLESNPVTTWSANPDEIVVGTLNALNLFDDVDDPYHADEGTPAKPREEIEHLAATIRKMNVDVLAMQEVENRGYLERFVKVMLADMGYAHIAHFEGNDLRGIDVALLSRAPIGEVTSRRHLKFTGPDGVERQFNRDVPAISVLPKDAQPIEFWPVHLKSKAGGAETSEPIRQAEATQLRKLLDARLTANPEARVIVLGDFNDTRDSVSMKTIFGTGSTAMWAPEMTMSEDSLENDHPEWAPIDFITSSSAMAKLYVPDSCKIKYAPPEIDGSDHNPIWARFKLN